MCYFCANFSCSKQTLISLPSCHTVFSSPSVHLHTRAHEDTVHLINIWVAARFIFIHYCNILEAVQAILFILTTVTTFPIYLYSTHFVTHYQSIYTNLSSAINIIDILLGIYSSSLEYRVWQKRSERLCPSCLCFWQLFQDGRVTSKMSWDNVRSTGLTRRRSAALCSSWEAQTLPEKLEQGVCLVQIAGYTGRQKCHCTPSMTVQTVSTLNVFLKCTHRVAFPRSLRGAHKISCHTDFFSLLMCDRLVIWTNLAFCFFHTSSSARSATRRSRRFAIDQIHCTGLLSGW